MNAHNRDFFQGLFTCISQIRVIFNPLPNEASIFTKRWKCTLLVQLIDLICISLHLHVFFLMQTYYSNAEDFLRLFVYNLKCTKRCGKFQTGGLWGQQLIHLNLLSDKCCARGKYPIYSRAFVESPSCSTYQ